MKKTLFLLLLLIPFLGYGDEVRTAREQPGGPASGETPACEQIGGSQPDNWFTVYGTWLLPSSPVFSGVFAVLDSTGNPSWQFDAINVPTLNGNNVVTDVEVFMVSDISGATLPFTLAQFSSDTSGITGYWSFGGEPDASIQDEIVTNTYSGGSVDWCSILGDPNILDVGVQYVDACGNGRGDYTSVTVQQAYPYNASYNVGPGPVTVNASDYFVGAGRTNLGISKTSGSGYASSIEYSCAETGLKVFYIDTDVASCGDTEITNILTVTDVGCP
jgi:hypothetical protein